MSAYADKEWDMRKAVVLAALVALTTLATGCAFTIGFNAPAGGAPQLMAIRNSTGLDGTIDIVAGQGLAIAGLPNGAMGVDPRSWQGNYQSLPVLAIHRNTLGEVDGVASGFFSLNGWSTSQNIWDVTRGDVIPTYLPNSAAATYATPERVRMRVPRVWVSGLAVLQVGMFRKGYSLNCTASGKKGVLSLSYGEWWADTFPAMGGRYGGVSHTLACSIRRLSDGSSMALPTFSFWAQDYQIDGHQFLVLPEGELRR